MKAFASYAVFTFLGILFAYATVGGVIWIGLYSIPTAGILALLIFLFLMALASN